MLWPHWLRNQLPQQETGLDVGQVRPPSQHEAAQTGTCWGRSSAQAHGLQCREPASVDPVSDLHAWTPLLVGSACPALRCPQQGLTVQLTTIERGEARVNSPQKAPWETHLLLAGPQPLGEIVMAQEQAAWQQPDLAALVMGESVTVMNGCRLGSLSQKGLLGTAEAEVRRSVARECHLRILLQGAL